MRFDVEHLYARWTGVKPRRLKIQETLGSGLCRLRLTLLRKKSMPFWKKVEQDRRISSYDIPEELRIDHKAVLTHLKKKLDIQKGSILGSYNMSSLKEI
ncbi:hypothetical protein EVAR_69688_1 [Eumeta japonica]|uniref:Uncharacterized protein n=1 Tax=Eumeta variegata TaxID=151549 RepID=A0A4C2AHB1_EUMVA|nr:hypothetical protein EVAR_69688_1 [Eumeta japonica]